jgi:ABC-type antimicrobial peptide transport system permease subunit
MPAHLVRPPGRSSAAQDLEVRGDNESKARSRLAESHYRTTSWSRNSTIRSRLRRIPARKENDFELSSADFLSNLWNQLTGALVILTTMISSIGLLVGGVGVMNIMLISVTERTKEIGVRKAIGARRGDVRLHFLLEAVVLTRVGGTIGILIGAAISTMVRTLMASFST